MARQNLTVFLSSPSFHHLIPPSPGEATHYFFFFAQITNSYLGRSQRKVPGLGLGLVPGIHLWNWGKKKENWEDCHWQESKQELDLCATFTPPLHSFNAFSSTASSLCCSFSILFLFTFLYLTPSLSSVPTSLPLSLPAGSFCSPSVL